MKQIFLGLGSNLGDREETLARAVEALEANDLHIVRVSPLYETEPQGLAEQNWFLNLVVEASTSLFPLQLLKRIQRIERDFGRLRLVSNGPRTLDIDILFYSRAIIRLPDLEVPHPRLSQRRFVLAPMADLAPAWRDPLSGKTIRYLLDELKGQKVRKGSKGSTVQP